MEGCRQQLERVVRRYCPPRSDKNPKGQAPGPRNFAQKTSTLDDCAGLDLDFRFGGNLCLFRPAFRFSILLALHFGTIPQADLFAY